MGPLTGLTPFVHCGKLSVSYAYFLVLLGFSGEDLEPDAQPKVSTMKIISSLTATLLLALTVQAQVTHIYVDAKSGKDSNPGTKAMPYKTFTKGVLAKKTNAVIHVMPGVYGPATTGDFWDATLKKTKNIALRGAQNIEIVGTDRATCILDFNGQGGQWGFLSIQLSATSGIEIHNLTFRNCDEKAGAWGTGAISVNGAVKKINIHHNEFVDTLSSIIVWGGYDVSVHDNLFRHTKKPAKWTPVAVRVRVTGVPGNGERIAVYNNVIYGLSTIGNLKLGHGISWNSKTTNPVKWICNNIAIACDKGFPDAKKDTKTVIESNIAFNCLTNFAYKTLSKTNRVIDPKLVNPAKGDFHQAKGSPCLEAGYPLGLPNMDNDWFGSNRAVDVDRNSSVIPDIGLHEVADLSMSVKNWAQGKTAIFTLSRASTFGYGGVFLLGGGRGGLLVPGLGVIGMNLGQIAFVTSATIPGAVALPIPSTPSLKGLQASMQALGFRAVGGKLRFEMTGTMRLDLD